MIAISIFLMLILCFLGGIVIQKILDQRCSITGALMGGFLFLLSIFQVIAYPMIRLDTPFSLLFGVYSCVLLIISVYAIFLLLQKTIRSSYKCSLKIFYDQFCQEKLLFFLTILFASYILFLSFGYSYASSDDSYYLPRTMEMLAQNRLGISHGLGWTGVEVAFTPTTDASTLEAWRAYWSYLFGMHPTIFSRNTLAFVIHIISWCSLYQAYHSIAKDKGAEMSVCAFFCIYFLLIAMDNNTTNKFTIAFRTIRYPTQGKALLPAIIQPALITACAHIVSCEKQKIPWQKWAMLSMTLTAGIACTIIGVYWPFLCCLTMGIPYLLLVRFKDLPKLIPSLLLTSLPVIIYAGLALTNIVTQNTHYLSSSLPGWYDALTESVNTKRLGLLFVCLGYLAFTKHKTGKLVILGGFVTLICTWINPLLTEFVAKNITTGSVYSRLFWMIPVYFLPAFAAADIVGRIKLKTRKQFAVVVSFCLVLTVFIGSITCGLKPFGRNLVKKIQPRYSSIELRSNDYSLPQGWYDAGRLLLQDVQNDEKVRVLSFSTERNLIRQYSERIELVGGVKTTHRSFFSEPFTGSSISPNELWQEFEKSGYDFADTSLAHTQMLEFGVQYVFVDSNSSFAKRENVPYGFELINVSIPKIKLYRVLDC